jgi:hypothetical protein
MANALSELRIARGYLDSAEHDKGGWRARAMETTNTAIRETENGCPTLARGPNLNDSQVGSSDSGREENVMNLWKPIALCSIAALAYSAVESRVSFASPHGGECRDQVNMANALRDLRAARGWLEKAEHNKGGWRVAAIEKANAAIADTERGCSFADR